MNCKFLNSKFFQIIPLVSYANDYMISNLAGTDNQKQTKKKSIFLFKNYISQNIYYVN